MAADHWTGPFAEAREAAVADAYRRFRASIHLDFELSLVRRVFQPYPYAFGDGLVDGDWHEEECPVRMCIGEFPPSYGEIVFYHCPCGYLSVSLKDEIRPGFYGTWDRISRVEMRYLKFARQLRSEVTPFTPIRSIGQDTRVVEHWWAGQCPECFTLWFAVNAEEERP